jgi:pantothenate kinase
MVSGNVKIDDLLDLEIKLDSSERPLKTRGRVVHIRTEKTAAGTENLAGVAFLKLSDQQREAIGKKVWRQILEEATRIMRKP